MRTLRRVLLVLGVAAGAAALAAPISADSAPVITPVVIAGTAGDNGWYVSNVTVRFDISGSVTSSSGCDIVTLTAEGTNNSLSCTATGPGGTASSQPIYKIDKTAPNVSGGAPTRAADSNGWFNHGLTVAFAGNDGVSGLASCSSIAYAGPDSAGTSVNGTCRDNAGNTSAQVASSGFKYDATAPSAAPSASRAPDANGWYNHQLTVSFAGVDPSPGSGGVTCTAPVTYGADNGSASVPGSCTDAAGNARTAALALKYDGTAPNVTGGAPTRAADSNGWFNHALTVAFAGTDALSGLASCDSVAYPGPDSAGSSVTGRCRDNAGNASALISSQTFKFDATAPSAVPAASRPADVNGWYNHALSVSFAGVDPSPGSGGVTCTAPVTYSADNGSASVPGSCTDAAGNARTAAFALKYDATAPAVSGGAPTRAADSNGWFNHGLTVAFSGSDQVSGLASCDSVSYAGPDSAGASVTGRCLDNAGNASALATSSSFKYDGTAPSAAASASRGPDANGWYNHALSVSFSGVDISPGSGGVTCTAPVTYGGPDKSSASVAGTCSDLAGNSRPASLGLQYDATPPAVTGIAGRDPDSRGWYNHPLPVAFAGHDDTSGVSACSSTSYGGPDAAQAAVGGSCTDNAGNLGTGSLAVAYDATPPSAGPAAPERVADRNGWYNHALSVSFAGGDDATSGIESCSTARYEGPDSASASATGTCRDNAGNVSDARAFAFRYDATGPAVNASPSRGPDANGWYNHAVSVGFGGTDAASGLESCTSGSYAGPDGASASVAGSCTDAAGNVGSASFALKYDATAPVVTPHPGRDPDNAGWYRQPVVVAFIGTDGASGIDSCTSATYSGPDSVAADVTGSCRDVAGNAASRAFTLRFDATPPRISGLVADIGNRSVKLRWTDSEDTESVTVTRAASGRTTQRYEGSAAKLTDGGLTNGQRYRYTVTARDAAGNTASASVDATPLALFSPAQGVTLRVAPTFAWAPVAHAAYYNVQVFHNGKVLSLWPRQPHVAMPRTWTFGGKKYRLAPGLYRWYVWPGFGKRDKSKYGKPVGSSYFVMAGVGR